MYVRLSFMLMHNVGIYIVHPIAMKLTYMCISVECMYQHVLFFLQIPMYIAEEIWVGKGYMFFLTWDKKYLICFREGGK